MTAALDAVLAQLRCPVCAAALARHGGNVVCADNHAFDVARQGYLNLHVGHRGPGTGDTAAMVAARDRFLRAGHFEPIAAAVAGVVGDGRGDGLLVDLAGGAGYYLATALERAPERLGVCLDLSAPALKKAARAHSRAAAVGADVWATLPIASGCAAAVLSIFGPRNPAEVARVLSPDGLFVVVSPTPAHLRELVEPLGLVNVDPGKDAREAHAFAGFALASRDEVEYRIPLDRAAMGDVIAMGPSARHVDDLANRLHALPDPLDVTVCVRVAVYRLPPPTSR